MDNYEYLIAGLPVLSKDWSANSSVSVDSLIEEIKNGCSKKDNVLIDSLLDGYKEENFNEDFYKSMLRHKNSFIREFFTFDLRVRNAKVRYLNEQLGRNTDKDIFLETEGEFEESEALMSVLYGDNLIDRELGLDELMWNKISELNIFEYFNINVLLGYISKLKIIGRWLSLDEKTGKEMFRRLVEEIRGTFKGVEFNE
ncbi:MAG: DUF2764 family protein [Bacteroidales bacterium]|nr:DUF2764 family protein [Bacteroidales bacterium]MCI5619404.1 DUF2764 domain-containing protein [Rikenellaceae bacterium]